MLRQQELEEILSGLRNRLWPSSHFQQRLVKGTTPAVANADFVVQHDLNRILAGTGANGNEPGAEFIYWLNGPGQLYVSANGDANSFTLRCTEASRGYTILVR